jgi:hypothetical protein
MRAHALQVFRCIVASLAVAAAPLMAQAPAEQFIFVGKGEVKGRALLDSTVVCEFRKYVQGLPGVASSRLLAFRFTRDVTAEQVRQMFRGIVQGEPGYSAAELEALTSALPAMAKGSTMELRWGAGTPLEIRPQAAARVSVPASAVAEAAWMRLGREPARR